MVTWLCNHGFLLGYMLQYWIQYTKYTGSAMDEFAVPTGAAILFWSWALSLCVWLFWWRADQRGAVRRIVQPRLVTSHPAGEPAHQGTVTQDPVATAAAIAAAAASAATGPFLQVSMWNIQRHEPSRVVVTCSHLHKYIMIVNSSKVVFVLSVKWLLTISPCPSVFLLCLNLVFKLALRFWFYSCADSAFTGVTDWCPRKQSADDATAAAGKAKRTRQAGSTTGY